MTRAKDISKIVTDADLSGTLDVTGEVNLSANLNLGDNDKAVFGAGSDLTIFSDGGSFSYINNTQGVLRIRNTSDDQDIVIQSDNGSGGVTDYFMADGSSGEARLFHYGSEKLNTTSTGIDVTGNVDISSGQLDLDASYRVRWGASNNYSIMSDNANYIQFNTAGSERMRIDSSGNLLVGKTSVSTLTIGVEARPNGSFAAVKSGGANVFARNTNDGDILIFRQDGTQEGSISVSGTTVSYNGGHLARLSRLLDNSKDASIVKGTVMTNLNEMVEWTTQDGIKEDNEQLNKMAVSSIEGDANVSGVFVSWDNDDDYNDMMIAMTGDMVIRIAKDTTVSRGDLLMSAGDGTAKPQGDDIVKSKTIAKVTSTNKSHTYDDGTYLVPCVLMAC